MPLLRFKRSTASISVRFSMTNSLPLAVFVILPLKLPPHTEKTMRRQTLRSGVTDTLRPPSENSMPAIPR